METWCCFSSAKSSFLFQNLSSSCSMGLFIPCNDKYRYSAFLFNSISRIQPFICMDSRAKNTHRSRVHGKSSCSPAMEELHHMDDQVTANKMSAAIFYQSGDPLGRKELGKCVVNWISRGMRAMAIDFTSAEMPGESDSDVRQKTGLSRLSTGDLTFVDLARPYLNAIPMPRGFEAVCLKASTHYPTLFDHFQRELRGILQDLQSKSLIQDWRSTESWKQLKELATSAQHRAVVRKATVPSKFVHGSLGMQPDKVKFVQTKIDEYVEHMLDLLHIEREVELEYTQKELNAVPTTVICDTSKPIEYLVRHEQAQHEQCDTICNLIAVSSSKGLGGMHLIVFRVHGIHRLPPTTLSPGDMVCVRTCDSRGSCAGSCMQGFVNNLGDDGCSITIALEARYGASTFSKLFGKSIRVDRIHGLADSLTYERNCEALMLLQKNGLLKKNPSIGVVTTLFGDEESVKQLANCQMGDWGEEKLQGVAHSRAFDKSQLKAISLGSNKNQPLLAIQGPPGTGKTGVLKEIIARSIQQSQRVLMTAPTNAAVDNMVERLLDSGLDIVRVGNPARISATVASRSLAEIVNVRLASFRKEFERKRRNLRNDLKLCLKDDSLAAGIRKLLKQLGKTMKNREKKMVEEILSNAHVVLTTNTGAADPTIRRMGSFDLVVIDEAGQAIEASCWIPMLQGKRCVLSGDQCQLAPVILSKKALEGGLGISLLQKVLDLNGGVLSTRLTVQYRMHDAIASWASKEMYDGLLQSSPSVSSHLLADSPFVKATWITLCPLLLLDTRLPHGSLCVECEEHLDLAGTGSFYNEGEADIVVQHVFSLIYAGVPPTTIAVQSPYVAQVQMLRDRLDEHTEAAGVEVATIDSFQGRESDAVIISMVRSNTLGAVGFLGDSRRMNVAITRARKHVALVCDSSTVCHDSFLARLLRHIRRFGRVKHAEPGASGSGLRMDPMLPSLS